MIKLAWHRNAWEDYLYWHKTNKVYWKKINTLVKDSLRNPFSGIGKPEPLIGNYAGCWSRRISKEHRLIYKVTDTYVTILSCRFHYD